MLAETKIPLGSLAPGREPCNKVTEAFGWELRWPLDRRVYRGPGTGDRGGIPKRAYTAKS